MLRLIITILIGLAIGYFATQNTGNIVLKLDGYTAVEMPEYVAIVGATLIGLFLGWLLSLGDTLSGKVSMRGKEKELREQKDLVAELTRKVHVLELENARLAPEDTEETDDKSI